MSGGTVLHLPDLRGSEDAPSGTGWQAVAVTPEVSVPTLRDARWCARTAKAGPTACERRVVSFDPFDGATIVALSSGGLRVEIHVLPGFPEGETPVLRVDTVPSGPSPVATIEGTALAPCRTTLVFEGVLAGASDATYRLTLVGYDPGDVEVTIHRFRSGGLVIPRDRCAITLAPTAASVLPTVETPPAAWPLPPLLTVDRHGCILPAWWVSERGWLLAPRGTNGLDVRQGCAGPVILGLAFTSPIYDAIVWRDTIVVLSGSEVLRFDLSGCPLTSFPFGESSTGVALGISDEGNLLVIRRVLSLFDSNIIVFRSDGSQLAAPGAVDGRGWYARHRNAAFTFDADVCAYGVDPSRVATGCCIEPARSLSDDESLFFRLVDDLPDLRKRVAYPIEGVVILGPNTEGAVLDAGRPGIQWHRVLFFGDIPLNGVVDVETRATDDFFAGLPMVPDGWSLVGSLTAASAGLVQSPGDQRAVVGDALVLSGPGRYLSIRLTLRGSGNATPRITAMEIDRPREGIGRFLPSVFQNSTPEDDFLRRWLALFETTSFDGIAARMDAYPELFDPRTAPDAMLPYLASWLDIYLPDLLLADLDRLRKILIAAPELARSRGTVDGIVLAVKLYLGVTIQIVESFRTRSRFVLGTGTTINGITGVVLGCDTLLTPECAPTYLGDSLLGSSSLLERDERGGVIPFRFTVMVPAHAVCSSDVMSMLGRLVEIEKPAHTTFCVQPIAPAGWVVGIASIVGQELGPGYNRQVQDPATYGLALLNGPPRPKPLERGLVLGIDSRLAADEVTGGFRLDTTLGRDTRL